MGSISSSKGERVSKRARESARELERARRAMRVMAAANRVLAAASDETALVRAMCKVCIEEGGYRLVWVAYAEHDEEKTLRLAACAGTDGDAVVIPRSWAGRERNAAVAAISSGKPCIKRDLRKSGAAAKRGYRSIAGLPLCRDGRVLGAISVYSDERDAFDEAEMSLLGGLAHELAYGIAALRGVAGKTAADEMLARLASYDSLTGLYNRARFRQEVARKVHAADAASHPFAVMLIDIDHFREINEGLGYAGGDLLLTQMGGRLRATLGVHEGLARLGEDEFAVLIPGASARSAMREAGRVLGALDEPFDVSGFAVGVRVSIGIAHFPEHGSDADTLMLHAGHAAHEAKHASSGCAVYTGGRGRDNRRRLGLIGDLNHAIENDQLLLYCQPKVDIRSHRVCGAEALVRWRHPELGMISLGELIPLAERTGQIRPLTHWIVDAALRQSRRWSKEGLDVPIAVNVSVRNLREPAFFDRIYGLLQRWGTRAGLLQVELTESALMEDPAGALEVLTRLRALGIRIFIDDFGTGYSSLSYLQKLPIDTIKIDQVFVRNIAVNEESAKIVHSTIELAHNLDRSVVAEGVEEKAVWDRLAEFNCDTAQGYYISKPIPAGEFKGWLARSPWPV